MLATVAELITDKQKRKREVSRKCYLNNRDKIKGRAKQYRKDNPERCASWSKRFYDKRRKLISEYKLSKGCKVCGYNKCASALDFHHEGNKDSCMAHLLVYKIETIQKEIDKCIVLCANCHRELHFKGS